MNYEANEPCIVTKLEGRGLVTYHHLLSRKAWPEHSACIWNKIPVSQKTHNDFHNHGTAYMASKYSSVMEWLLSNGWYVCKLTGKWRNPKA